MSKQAVTVLKRGAGSFECENYLRADGVCVRGRYSYENEGFIAFEPKCAGGGATQPYFTFSLPYDMHCHGVADVDFGDIGELDLSAIDDRFRIEGVRGILTLYLEQLNFDRFIALCHELGDAIRSGAVTHIEGLALEGPMLISPGGTPMTTVWSPTKQQWRRLASCGGTLKYVVLSPDVGLGNSEFLGSDNRPSSVEWIVETLIEGGVRPALGHFRKDAPAASAQCVRSLLAIARRRDARLISDHLYNDMPRRFKHAWRSSEEKVCRADEVAALALDTWSLENLADRVGHVPAALIEGALEGALSLCLNFDGDHVDLDIAVRTLELVGAKCIMGMTDRAETLSLARRPLSRSTSNSLTYQEGGIVAAGTQSPDRQMGNLRSHGVSEADIWTVFAFNAAELFDSPPAAQDVPGFGSFVAAGGDRRAFSYRPSSIIPPILSR